MALALSLIGAGIANATDASSYNYSATGLTIGTPYCLGAVSSHATAAPVMGLTASGVTFSELDAAGGLLSINGLKRMEAWVFLATATSHTIAIAATNATSMDAAIAELDGADPTTPIVTSNVVTLAKLAATNITVTTATLSNVDNRLLIFVTHATNEGHTFEAGYTELYDAGHAAPVNSFAMAWGTPGDTTPLVSWTGNTQSIMYAIEVAAAVTATTPVRSQYIAQIQPAVAVRSTW